MSKVLEKVIHKRMMEVLVKNDILYNKQFGFRPGHFATDAIHTLTCDALRGFDDNASCLSVYLDLSKAFTSHHITSHHITSHHITLHYITSQHHITSSTPTPSLFPITTVSTMRMHLLRAKQLSRHINKTKVYVRTNNHEAASICAVSDT